MQRRSRNTLAGVALHLIQRGNGIEGARLTFIPGSCTNIRGIWGLEYGVSSRIVTPTSIN
jgi:hypothetical protein